MCTPICSHIFASGFHASSFPRYGLGQGLPAVETSFFLDFPQKMSFNSLLCFQVATRKIMYDYLHILMLSCSSSILLSFFLIVYSPSSFLSSLVEEHVGQNKKRKDETLLFLTTWEFHGLPHELTKEMKGFLLMLSMWMPILILTWLDFAFFSRSSELGRKNSGEFYVLLLKNKYGRAKGA